MALAKKQLRSFRLGRVNVRKEARRQARLRSSLERPLLKKLETVIRKSVRTAASSIESNTYEPLVVESQLREEGIAVLSNHIRKVYQAVFQQNEERYEDLTKAETMSVFGRNVDIERLSRAYLQDRELVLANVFSNISEQIDRIIGEGFLEDGLSQREIADRIRQKAPQISKSRAALITRTETHSAVGHAQHAYHEVLRDSIGVNMSKRWVSTADGRTRSAHAAANGQIVEMDEDFLVGGARMRFTGDPRGGARNVINCRCTVVYVNDEDMEDAIDTAKPYDAPSGEDYVPKLVGFRLGKTQGSKSTIKRSQDGGGEKARKRLQANFKDAAKQWGVANEAHTTESSYGRQYDKTGLMFRFSGRTEKQIGAFNITKNKLKKVGYTDEQADIFLQAVDEAIQDCNELAKKFKIPPLRGTSGIRGRAEADMGDGIIGLSPKVMKRHLDTEDVFGNRIAADDLSDKLKDGRNFDRGKYAKIYPKNPQVIGDIDSDVRQEASRIRSQRPFLTDAYLDNGVDQLKNTIYHEFGHHIHQTHSISLKSALEYIETQGARKGASFYTKIESLMRTKYRKNKYESSFSDTLAPSRYGDHNEAEWFAENFAMWVVGKDEVVAPRFFELMDEIIELTAEVGV